MRFLNEQLELMKEANLTSLIWHEKYYETGFFEIVTTHVADEPTVPAFYFYNTDNQQLGLIERKEYLENTYRYSGTTLEGLLGHRVINQRETFEDSNVEYIVSQLVQKYAGDIVEVDIPTNINEDIDVQIIGENLLEYCQSLLKTIKKSLKVEYDYVTNKMQFKIYGGENNVDKKIPISQNFETVISENISLDNTSYKNYAYILGEETNEIIVAVDMRKSATDTKREIFLDGSHLTREIAEGIYMSEYQYMNVLKQFGYVELAKYNKTLSVDIVPQGKDFEIGELRLYKNDFLNIEQRVVEIMTGWYNGIIETSIILEVDL